MDIDRKIADIVAGRSFVDIGGLWGTENERVTVAHAAGAKSVAMVDIQHEGTEWWKAFKDRCVARGVNNCTNIVANLDSLDFASKVPATEIVHCSGIIYHTPTPIWTIAKLRDVTVDTLLLCSMTVPEVIKTEVGTLDMAGGMVIFVPALEGQKREIVRAYFERMSIKVHNINSFESYAWRNGEEYNYEPWWWLWTPTTLVRMVETAGFRVRETFDGWQGYSHYLVCERA
jgi:hypothetical protein